MSLRPIEHARRLTSPAEAERLFRALGAKRVSTRGFHTKDPARFAALVAAIEPKREHTISFEDGVLDLPSFAALALTPFSYLDVRTRNANYRSWPDRETWVHARCDLERACEVFETRLTPGENLLPGAKVTFADGNVNLEVKSIPTALTTFSRLTEKAIDRGFIMSIAPAAKAALVTFLERADATVNAVLELESSAARTLTELYAGEKLDWQAEGILVDFPDGRIHGFLKTPNTGDADRAKWQARLDKALRKAGLA